MSVIDFETKRLMRRYPLGSRVTFRTYHPAIWPYGWRRRAQRESWGLRRGDELEVVGYGASSGFPEALMVRRASDGREAMVFPAELEVRAQNAVFGEEADLVLEAASESFPASDPPAWVPVALGRPAVAA